MNKFQEKQAAKVERYRQYAENARLRGRSMLARSDEMGACIPMGQPILVGHHSERADRRFRERMNNLVRSGFKELDKASHFEKRAESVESSRAIFSDDPEAMDKLDSKVERLEAYREEIKRINTEFRANGGKLELITMNEAMRAKCLQNMQIWGGGPFPAYVLTNLGARIRTAKKRTDALSRAEDFQGFEVNEIRVELTEGQIQVHFPYKPNENTRKKLKTHPISLKWSSYSRAWVRKYTGQGAFYSDLLKAALSESEAE